MIHVQVWSGSGTARITDMTNAGKRGKRCRVLSILGDAARVIDYLCTTTEQIAVRSDKSCYVLECRCVNEFRDDDFDGLTAELRVLAGSGTRFDEREIRSVDAPRKRLIAGVDGEWSAAADEDGISLHDLKDINEWTEITHRQTRARAYDIARRVWPHVQEAKTLHEASRVLTAAGARLHGFCGLD